MERTTLETVVAVIVGIILGTLVAVSLWLFKTGKINLNFKPSVVNVKITPTPTSNTAKGVFSLSVSNPQDGSVVNDPKITLSGKAATLTQIIVSLNDQDIILNTDNNGDFKTVLTLNEGDNEIMVTAISSDQNTKQQKLTVVYQKKN